MNLLSSLDSQELGSSLYGTFEEGPPDRGTADMQAKTKRKGHLMACVEPSKIPRSSPPRLHLQPLPSTTSLEPTASSFGGRCVRGRLTPACIGIRLQGDHNDLP